MNEYWACPYVPDGQKIKSPLRYPGGKFYALKHIMPYIECIDHDEYREPFLGGGSVFFAKKKAAVNVLNDIEEEIINFYRIVQDASKMPQLLAKIDGEVATRQRHAEIKEFMPQDDVEAAFKTFYLNRTSYCGIINTPAWGYAEGKSSPPQNWKNFILKAAQKLEGVTLHAMDFTEIIRLPAIGKRTFMYLDPPYYHADQRRAYTKPFEPGDHIRLAEELKATEHFFCLSYDDCPEIRSLYDWAYIYDVSWLYNTDNNSGNRRKTGNELIITNYKVNHL